MLVDIRSSLPTFCGIFGQTVLRLSAVGHQENHSEVLQHFQLDRSEDETKLSAVGQQKFSTDVLWNFRADRSEVKYF